MEMKSKREFPITRLLLAFIIATILFVLVFTFVYSVSYINYQSTKTNNNIINFSLYSHGELNCSSNYFYSISSLLDNSGMKISLLEDRLGKNDKTVLELKKTYTSLQFEHLALVKEYNNKCSKTFQIILFFYSNDDDSVKESEKVGYILDTIKLKYPKKFMIYSFDANLNYKPIKDQISKYDLSIFPAILFDDSVLPPIENIRQVEGYLNNITLSEQ